VHDVYVQFSTMVYTHFSNRIKVFRSDSSGEYHSKKFLDLLKSHDTLPQLSCPHTPQQNGVFERKHRHIIEIVCTLLFSSKLHAKFWGEAALTSSYLINRIPSRVLQNKSPYELLYGTPPDYTHLRTFGSTGFVLLPSNEWSSKFSTRLVLCTFVGYAVEQKCYRCGDSAVQRVRISRNVTFWEDIPFMSLPKNNNPTYVLSDPFSDYHSLFPSEHPPHRTSPTPHSPLASTLSLSSTVSASPTPSLSLVSPLVSSTSASDTVNLDPARYLSRICHPPSYLNNFNWHALFVFDAHEPRSHREASAHSEWVDAMHFEITALQKTNTWQVTTLHPGKTLVGCRWVYRVKTRADGYKARLVAQGFT